SQSESRTPVRRSSRWRRRRGRADRRPRRAAARDTRGSPALRPRRRTRRGRGGQRSQTQAYGRRRAARARGARVGLRLGEADAGSSRSAAAGPQMHAGRAPARIQPAQLRRVRARRRRRAALTRRGGGRTLRREPRQPLPDGARRARSRAQTRLQPALVSRPATGEAERDHGLRARLLRRAAPRLDADRGRAGAAAADAVPERARGAPRDGRDRLARDADPDRALLRQPTARPRRRVRAVRAGRGRDLGVLERPHRVDAGRAGRDPRHERAVVDRARRLERVHPAAEWHAAPRLRAGRGRYAGDNPHVRRALAVAALVALALAAAAWRLADVKPDPNVQALADGCQRDGTKLFTGLAPNWVYVNDRDFPANGPPPPLRTLTGVVKGASGLLAARVSSSDNPLTHV